jgi:chemotaxis protein methyltransferase CheR
MNGTYQLTDTFITTVKDVIREKSGIIIQDDRYFDVQIVLGSRLIKTGLQQDHYIDLLRFDDKELVLLASYFTIQETSFYRYRAHFDRLKNEIISRIVNQNAEKKLCILSAGCATGEEPYTIAMIISEAIPDMPNWDIRIIGTDINETALQFAKEGLYSPYKFRNIDDHYREKYFSAVKSGKTTFFKINDAIKNMVSFRQCNLIREPFELADLSNVDVIFCENVIIYFNFESIDRLINNLFMILKSGGFLFLGYSETLNMIKHSFQLSWWNDSYAYVKPFPDLESRRETAIPEFQWRPTAENNSTPFALIDFFNLPFDQKLAMIGRRWNDGDVDFCKQAFHSIENTPQPLDERYYLLKGEFLFCCTNYMDAANEARKAIRLDPYSIDTHLLLAFIYLRLGMLDSADFEIKTVQYIEHRCAIAKYLQAVLCDKIGKKEETAGHLALAKTNLDGNTDKFQVRVFPQNKQLRYTILNEIWKGSLSANLWGKTE